MNKLGVFVCVAVATGIVAAAEPTITVKATPRYPWSGMVDFAFTITGDSGMKYDTSFVAKDVVGGTNLTMKTIHKSDGSAAALTNALNAGSYKWTWNAAADLPGNFVCDRVKVVGEVADLGGVQLWEDGPYWAECNVGATKPEEYGYYFWWGDTVGYIPKSNGGWVSVKDGTSFLFSLESCPTWDKSNSELQSSGYIDSTGNLAAAHDAATAHLGAPWRMPTDAEFDALESNCTTTWITTNGVKGQLVTGKGAYASKSIFLPAVGWGEYSDLCNAGSVGYYWSSTPIFGVSATMHNSAAWYLRNNSGGISRHVDGRFFLGQSVRPIRGFAK